MRELGLDSAAQVRAFLLKRSAVQVLYLLADIGINLGATLACYTTFGMLLATAANDPGPVRLALCGLSAFGAGWFGTTVAGDILLLGTTAVVTLRYGLAADAFLDVVKHGAADNSAHGSVFASTRAAASALAAAGALDDAMRTLQARVAAAPAPDTAASLASYFTLRAAEEERGFRPAALAMSERDALAVARAFDDFDANGDGVIDANELRALMCAAALLLVLHVRAAVLLCCCC